MNLFRDEHLIILIGQQPWSVYKVRIVRNKKKLFKKFQKLIPNELNCNSF